MNQWRKNIAQWKIGTKLYLSIPFTWLLPKAKEIAENHKGKVYAGGPAVDLMPDVLSGVAEYKCQLPARPLDFHNPLATFTTRGCVNNCPFCAVPKIEGDLKELDIWPVRPVVCDNNLLAASRNHFDTVIDKLKGLPYVDFNQGLDARLFNRHHATRMAELKGVKVRFALDHVNLESKVYDAIQLARSEGLKNFGVYVLFGFRDTPDDARHRLDLVHSWKIRPFPMRYQPLDALEKNKYVDKSWDIKTLRNIHRYYSKLAWLEHIPFDEYRDNRQMKLF